MCDKPISRTLPSRVRCNVEPLQFSEIPIQEQRAASDITTGHRCHEQKNTIGQKCLNRECDLPFGGKQRLHRRMPGPKKLPGRWAAWIGPFHDDDHSSRLSSSKTGRSEMCGPRSLARLIRPPRGAGQNGGADRWRLCRHRFHLRRRSGLKPPCRFAQGVQPQCSLHPQPWSVPRQDSFPRPPAKAEPAPRQCLRPACIRPAPDQVSQAEPRRQRTAAPRVRPPGLRHALPRYRLRASHLHRRGYG